MPVGSSTSVRPRLLLGPGPSPVTGRILEALARPTVGHLDPQFLSIMDDVNAMLRTVFATRNSLTFPISGTGSAAQEAALANVLESGDKAIIGINGVFGGRLADMARRMGCDAVTVEEEWGSVIDPARMIEAHRAHPDARALVMVHAETSTGAHQPLREVGNYVSATETMFVVDAVTSLAGVPVDVDANRIDVCYSGTQKCLGVPPGLAPITFSPKAVERIRTRKRPCQSWYCDAALLADYVMEGSERKYHHTAPVNMMYALHEGLVVVGEEGLDARFRRHAEVGARLQDELVGRGFGLFAQAGHRLPQLTSASLPGGRDESPLRRALLDRHDIEVGGGLGPARGKIWRVGLMGAGATHDCVDRLLAAVDELLD
jgi:alanine-glyoxylate transaminase/serine-glyoxylate transaminase/serine-pyruvate transaminase